MPKLIVKYKLNINITKETIVLFTEPVSGKAFIFMVIILFLDRERKKGKFF